MWKKSWQQLRERVDLIVLLAVLLVVATAWFFDELANSVTAGDTQRFDDWVVASLRNPDNTALPRGPRWLLEAGARHYGPGQPDDRGADDYGRGRLSGAKAAIQFTDLRHRGREQRRAVHDLAQAALRAAAACLWRPKNWVAKPLTSSFPSGHSMLSAVVYLLLGAMLAKGEPRWPVKLYFVGTAIVLTGLVGMSRVYLGVHYPSDVLAGWTAGLGWASGWWLLARWLERRQVKASNNIER